MRLLDRYLLRELLVPFCYCLAGFLIFWISSDILTQMSDYQKNHLRARDIAELYLVLTPGILVIGLPMVFLLALLYALTNHARHNELTAMRAAGIGLTRISLPYVAVGIMLSVAGYALNEYWVPRGNDAADEIQARHQTDRTAASRKRQWEPKVGFYNNLERRWWFIENYHLYTGEMIRPHVIWLESDGMRRDIFADRGFYDTNSGGGWVFTNVHRLISPTNQVSASEQSHEVLDMLSMPTFSETPEQIRSEIKIGKLRAFKFARKTYISIPEILEYRRLHPTGIPPELRVVLDTKLHGQLASPWTSLVVVAIALPFGARSGRRNVAVGVASSIFICFAYFAVRELSLALGTSGHLEPWIAAWAPNIIFGLAGLILCWRLP